MTASTGRERPWRAIAYQPDPTGQTDRGRKRLVTGRTAARTEAGLAGFRVRQEAQGNVVDVFTVESLAYDEDTTTTNDSGEPNHD